MQCSCCGNLIPDYDDDKFFTCTNCDSRFNKLFFKGIEVGLEVTIKKVLSRKEC